MDKTALIGKDGWRGVWTDGIDAAILHPNDRAYFFKGRQYKRFDFDRDEVDRTGVIGETGWRGGLWTDGIGAALEVSGTR